MEDDLNSDTQDEKEAVPSYAAEPRRPLTESLSAHQEEAQHPPHHHQRSVQQGMPHPAELPCRALTAQTNSHALLLEMCCHMLHVFVVFGAGDHVDCLTWALECTCATQAPSAVQDIMGPPQAAPETAVEDGEQTDVEDEPEAASPCKAELERPQAAEESNQGAIVVYQPPLQAISPAKVAEPGEESPPRLYHAALLVSA